MMRKNISGKEVLTRGISFGLSLVMAVNTIATGIVFDSATAAAESTDDYVLYVNDSCALKADDITVHYGDDMELSVDGYDGDDDNVKYYYIAGDTEDPEHAEWNAWTDDSHPTEVGEYYIEYNIWDSDTQIFKTTYSDDYFLKIVAATLKVSQSTLKWNDGSEATWSEPDETVSGGHVDEGAIDHYDVQLYKDGLAVGDAVSTDDTIYDFTDEILANGGGIYTYGVTAVSAETKHYKDSAEVVSDAETYAVDVNLVKGTGIKAFDPTGTSAVLIAGNTEYNTLTKQAVTSSGYSFSQWSIDDMSALTADDLTSDTAVFTLQDGDPGKYTVDVTAQTKDDIAPTVSEYTAGDDGTFAATFNDEGTGVAGYAFTTAAEESDVTDWTTVSGTPVHESVTYTVTAPGTYYVWVKDAAGNASRSDISYQATKVVYHDYYNGDDSEEHVGYLLGDNTLKLDTAKRDGYTFGGWYASADLSGDVVTQISTHSAESVNVYAKWTINNITFSKQPESVSKVYDSKTNTLTVAVANAKGNVSYQWYKNGTKIDGAVSASYSVKNVSDSGKYMAKVKIQIGDEYTEADSLEAVVSISRKSLTVTATDKNVIYGDESPSYTDVFTGWAGTENSSVLGGTVSYTCDYIKGSNVGTYDITASGYTSGNYNIEYVTGTLTVSAKDVTVADSGVSISDIDDQVYIKDGSICPDVVVKDGVIDLTDDDYDIAYSDNNQAGTAKVTVTFKGNYTGTLVEKFTIDKASFDANVTMQGWTYGDTSNEPVLDTNPGGGTVTYYYRKGTTGSFITTKPVDAGDYQVYASIAATDNYKKIDTDIYNFTVARRVITLTAASGEWIYDGNSHSDSSYTKIGTFVGVDDFLSVAVSGSVKEVGSAVNVVSYRLTSSTDADNYDIRCVNGELKVTMKELNAPSSMSWSSTTPGKASWVAVSKDEVSIKYEVSLYNISGELLTTVQTSQTSYDFSNYIKNKYTDATGFYFKVRAIPESGENSDNYSESELSNGSTNIYTILVDVEKTTGIESVSVAGATSAVLIQGETATLTVTVSEGYSLSDKVWDVSQDSGSVITVKEGSAGVAALTVSSTLSYAGKATLYAVADNDDPVIANYKAVRGTDGTSVTLSADIADTKALASYMYTTSSDIPDEDSDEWVVLEGKSATVTSTIDAAGQYYLWVKDDAGNIVGSDGITIYKIAFEAGSGAGEMESVLKIQNEDITLPSNVFVRSEYVFQQWNGSTGYYTDNSKYTANKNDILTALWTNETYNYTVEYYYMDTTGNYGTTADKSVIFTAVSGQQVYSYDDSLKIEKKGFAYDTTRNSSITVDNSGKTLKVYYSREKYTISYSYIYEGTPVAWSEDYYYEAVVTEADKPVKTGYTFVGWSYGESGSTPTKMPNKDISATGYFTADMTTYQVNCYTENLDGDGYELVSHNNYAATHKSTVSVTTADAPGQDGFTVSGITVTAGTVGGVEPGDMSDAANGIVTAESGKSLNINYYYTRNSYTLTLNVWKDNRSDDANKIYTKDWTLRYGESLDPADYDNYDQDNWTEGRTDLDEYVLADYTDWSTGFTPSVMPAGDVVVARDYILRTVREYTVQVYYEQADASYKMDSKFTYSANVGSVITAGKGSDYTVDVSTFKNSLLDTYSYYEYNADAEGSVLSGTVDDAGSLVLKVYFDRSDIDSTVTYYVDGKVLATKKISQKWGTSYTVKPDLFFDGVSADSSILDDYTKVDTSMIGTDFRHEGYVVSYGAYSSARWTAKQYTSSQELGEGLDFTMAASVSDSKNYVNVYYSSTPDTDKQVAIDVNYNTNILNQAGNVSYPVYVEGSKIVASDDVKSEYDISDSTKLYVRIVGHAYIYNDTYTSTAASDKNYPGAAHLNLTVTESDTMKSGFYKVSVNDSSDDAYAGDYYIGSDGTKMYLYILSTDNNLYMGSRVSCAFNKSMPGADVIENYLTQYRVDHGDSADADNYDSNYAGAYINYSTYSGVPTTQDVTYNIGFSYTDTCTVTYNLAGTTCSTHKYTKGNTVTIGCNHSIFHDKAGYTIMWYMDKDFTVPAADFKISSNTTIYGRYVKNTLTYHTYIYYEMPDGVTYNNGTEDVTTDYMTKTIKDSLEDSDSSALTKSASTEDITYTDGEGTTVTGQYTRTTYCYNGVVAMIDIANPSLSFSNISINLDDFNSAGYTYDSTNVKNINNGYCHSAAVDLVAYYKCNKHQLTVSKHNTRYDLDDVSEVKTNQVVDVAAPQKAGYTFAGWTFKIWDETADDGTGAWVEWTGAPELGDDGSGIFNMPDYDVKMSAKWDSKSITVKMMHYFQNSSKAYDTTTLSKISAGTGITTEIYGDWTVYYSGTDMLAASDIIDGVTYYYKDADISAGEVFVDDEDLFAAVSEITNDTGTTVQIDDAALEKNVDFGKMFTYSSTVYQEDTTIYNYTSGDSFTLLPDVTVNFYYALGEDFDIRVEAKAFDGGSAAGATVVGAGTFYYSAQAELNATIYTGYTLYGWYKASDVLEGYRSDDEKDLSAYSLKSDISEYTPVSTSDSYKLKVSGDDDYVIVTKPVQVSDASVAISGKNTYEYGYTTNSTDRVLTAVATLPADADKANFVYAYQWYLYNTDTKQKDAIDGATSATYNFPAAMNEGKYVYSCKVTIKRQDNGRTADSWSDDYTVKVAAASITTTAKGYSGVYDGKAHGVSVKVTDMMYDCTVYYSEEELTADNYLEKGTQDNLTYTDVKVDADGNVVSRKVYYYIKCVNSNYVDASGVLSVNITPKTVTLTAAATFSKVFDDSKEVAGDSFTQGSGQYELAHGSYYTINGLIESDSECVLDFDASFNSKHVDEADKLVMDNICVMNGADELNYNYTFADGYTFTMAGYIKAVEYNVDWNDKSFTYDGQSHAPTVTLADDKTGLEFEVGGAQTNVGSYTASVTLKTSALYETSDYVVENPTCSYTITKRNITVTPVEVSKTYNGSVQYPTEFTVDNVPEGQTYQVTSKDGFKDAGSRNVVATSITLYSAEDKNVTDNYEVSYASARFTVTPRTITVVDGITAANKVYDATTSAAIDVSGAQFDNVVEGDTVAISGVTGSFEDCNVGRYKSVVLDMTKHVLTGTSATNYVVDVDESINSVFADITAKTITVTPSDVTAVYGEQAVLKGSVNGLVDADKDKADTIIKGKFVYEAMSGTTKYTAKSDVGTYKVYVDVAYLSADNYVFVAGKTNGTLTVTPREVSVSASDSASVTKVYDGTTDADSYISEDDYVFTGLDGDSIKLTSFDAVYNTKNVSANKVTMSGLTLDNSNYELVTDTFDIPATITARNMTVAANDKSINYGETAEYTVKYTGLANTADIASFASGFVDCTYDVEDSDSRSAGTYSIIPAGYVNDNYNVTTVNGKLTVAKTELTVTADDKVITYGDEPGYTYSYDSSEFKYDDYDYVDTIVAGTVSYTCSRAGVTTEAGEYTVTPVVDDGESALISDNYTFTAKSGKLTIEKKELTISGVGVTTSSDGKLYYTGGVTAGIDKNNMVIEGLIDADVDQNLSSISGRFRNNNAGTGKVVDLTVTLGQYLDARYKLSSTSQKTVSGLTIYPSPLTITAQDSEVTYGDELAADLQVTCSGFRGKETVSVLGGSVQYTCSYSAGSDVGTYDIVPGGYTSSNYDITFKSGTLTVVSAAITAEKPAWDSTNPGTITWKASDGIANVEVASYELKLYDKSDKLIDEVTVASDATKSSYSYDFSDKLREAAAVYHVCMTAIPSTDSNEEYANVTESNVRTSTGICTAAVSMKINNDVVSEAGVVPGSVRVAGTTSYIAINGERDIPVTAELVNDTGYSVNEWSTTSGLASVSGIECSGTVVTGNLKVQLSNSDNRKVILTLAATQPQADVKIGSDVTELVYGYTEENTATLTATASAVSGDNIGTEDYTYTYRWQQWNPGNIYTDIESEAGAERIYVMPIGYGAGNYGYRCIVTATRLDNNQSSSFTSDYKFIDIRRAKFAAEVVLDDWTYGESRSVPHVEHNISGTDDITYYYSDSEDGTYTTEMPTDAGNYWVYAYIPQTDNYFESVTQKEQFTIHQTKLGTPTNPEWKASNKAERGVITWDSVEGKYENAGVASKSAISVSYEIDLMVYDNDSTIENSRLVKEFDGVTDTTLDLSDYINKNGTYYFTVKACSSNTDNCQNSAYSANSPTMTVATTLVSNVTDEETGASSFTKVYDGKQLTLGLKEQDEELTYQWYLNGQEIAGATDASYSITDVAESGYYQCKVDRNGTENNSNYQLVTIERAPQNIVCESVTCEYDGKSHSVAGSITYGEGTISYSGNDKIAAGEYVVNVTASQTDNYAQKTIQVPLVINRKAITVTADCAEKAYDGTALTNASVKPVTVIDGDSITAVATGSQISVGTSANKVDSVSIINDATGEDRTSSYDISYIDGTLKVTQATDTVSFIRDIDKIYDGEAVVATEGAVSREGDGDISIKYYEKNQSDDYIELESAPTDAGTYYVKAFEEECQNYFAAESDYKEFVISKALQHITADDVTVTYDGKVHGIVAQTDGDGEITYNNNNQRYATDDGYTVTITAAETVNYLKAVTTAKLTINKKLLTITASSASMIYDGTTLECKTVETADVVSGDAVRSCTVDGSRTEVGSVSNNVTNVVIENADGVDVTSCYEITYVAGKLEVTMDTDVVNITADISKTYDGQSVVATEGAVTRNSNGALNFKYYIKDDEGYTELEGAPSDAGTYYVKAFEEQSHNYCAAESDYKKFVIAKAKQDITASDVVATYDSECHSVAGAVTTGDGEVTYTGNHKTYAGSYTVTINASETQNYLATNKEVTLTINKRALTIKASSAEKVYDGTALTQESIEPVDQADVASGDAVTAVDMSSSITDAGTCANVISRAVISNAYGEDVTDSYDITYVDGELKVTKATDTLNISDTIYKVYDGETVAATQGAVSRSSDGELAFKYYQKDDNDDYTMLDNVPVNVGTYYVRALEAESDNYFAAESGYATLVIEPKEVSLNWNNTEFIYNGTAPEMSVTVQGVLNGDICDVNIQRDSSSTPGVYTATASIYNDNYKIVSGQSAIYTIENANISDVSVVPYEGQADGAVHAGAYVSGVASGDIITYRSSTDNGVTWTTWSAEVPEVQSAGSTLIGVRVQREHFNTYETQVEAKVTEQIADNGNANTGNTDTDNTENADTDSTGNTGNTESTDVNDGTGEDTDNSSSVDGMVVGRISGLVGKTFTVSVQSGNTVIDCKSGLSNESEFSFDDIADGAYNLVVSDGEYTNTDMIIIKDGSKVDCGTITVGPKQSKVEVLENAANIAVGGLNNLYNTSLFSSDSEAVATVDNGGSVEYKVVSSNSSDNDTIQSVTSSANDAEMSVDCVVDLTVNKIITKADGTSTTQNVTETGSLLRIAIPLSADAVGKSGYKLYRKHAGQMQELTQISSLEEEPADECFLIEGNYAYVWANKFSTYAITYASTDSSDTANDANSTTPGLSIANQIITLTGDEELDLSKYIPNIANAQEVIYHSCAHTIISVSNKGVVRGMRKGTSIVTVIIKYNGKYTAYDTTIKVVNPANPAKRKNVFKYKGIYYEKTGNKTCTVLINTKYKKKKVTIPATVKYKGKKYKVTDISAYAFLGNKKIKTVSIGKNVKTLNGTSFVGCSKLSKFVVAKKNKYFKTAKKKGKYAGMLLSKNGKTLYAAYCMKGKVTIPKSVKTIGMYAMTSAGMKELVIGKNVKTIYPCAFAHNGKLKKITFKGKVPSMPFNCIFDRLKQKKKAKMYVPKKYYKKYKAAFKTAVKRKQFPALSIIKKK